MVFSGNGFADGVSLQAVWLEAEFRVGTLHLLLKAGEGWDIIKVDWTGTGRTWALVWRATWNFWGC